MKTLMAIVLAALVAGCAASEARDRVLVARAAQDFGCAQDDVEVGHLSGDQYAARGCGHDGAYVCTPPKNPFAENFTCVPATLPRAPAPAPMQVPAPSSL